MVDQFIDDLARPKPVPGGGAAAAHGACVALALLEKAYVRFAQARTFGKGKTEVLMALQQAIECPTGIMEEASKTLDQVARAGKRCEGHLLSDLLVVCELLRAAISGAYRIAQANLSLLEEYPRRRKYQHTLEQLLSSGRELYESVVSVLVQRAGLGEY
ncbi:MAG: cyclodeaminase/cyclohydrolase family protein [Deltaproteobacteria bacterium]